MNKFDWQTVLNWIFGFLLLFRPRALSWMWDKLTPKLSVGFWLNTLYWKIRNKHVFSNLVYETNKQETREMLFEVHQIHRRNAMNTNIPNAYGYESSIHKSISVPADNIRNEYVTLGLKQIDKRYKFNEDLTARQARVKEVFSDKYLGVFFDYQIDGLIAFVATICLASYTGCVFTNRVYKNCVTNIQNSIGNMEFETAEFSDAQVNDMIYVTSCLLPTKKLGDKFIDDVTLYFKHYKTNKPSYISTICYNTLLELLGEFRNESRI
jgi:hypothetical protein